MRGSWISPIGGLLVVATVCLVCRAGAEMVSKSVTDGEFRTIEYKILLNISGLSALDPMGTMLDKIAAELEMFDVSRSAGHRRLMYADTRDGKLGKGHYILRIYPDHGRPAKSKITLKGRWADIDQAERLEAPGVSPSKLEIDVVGGRKIYAVSYRIRLDENASFPGGKVTGSAVMKNIANRYPDLGEYLGSITGASKLVAPGLVDKYSGSVKLKAGQLVSSGEKKMDMDIFCFGKDAAVAELSYTVGAADEKNGLALYQELTSLLKKKGLLGVKQSTKTQYYFDYFMGGKSKRLR